MPGTFRSSVYRPLPVTNLKSSRRRNGWPTYLIAVASAMAVCLRCQRCNCAHDVGIAGAAADVAGEVVTDFALGRMRVVFEQQADAHDHPRRAEAALQCVVLMERRLYRMQCATTRRQAFDGRDRRSIRHYGKHRAGFDGLSVDIDGAGAALRRVATDMGSCEAEIVSQQMDQQFSGFDRSALNDAIDVDGHDVMLFIGFNHLFLRLASRVMGCPLMRGGCRRYRSPRRSEVELRCRRLSCEEPAASLQP